jgi:hypothetical protein
MKFTQLPTIEIEDCHPISCYAPGLGDNDTILNLSSLAMLALKTEADLIALHTGMVKENLHLEYKFARNVRCDNDPRGSEAVCHIQWLFQSY